jgi:hypothetical protein
MARIPSLSAQRKSLEAQWQRWQHHDLDLTVRPEVEQSWQRSSEKVSIDVDAAPTNSKLDIALEWSAHTLNTPVTTLEPELKQVAEEGGFVVAITDDSSTILWTTGGTRMRDMAMRANFAPGGMWDELSVGTNALDLALRTQKPQTVFSAEHFAPLVHQWVCYSAPLIDPRNGQAIGVLDLSTTWDNAHPLAMRTTVAMASLIQHELSKQPLQLISDEIHLNLLGKPHTTIGNHKLNLSRRQFEICALLAMHPNGLSLEELHVGIYGDQPISSSTLKSEISHLRTLLNGSIASRPYRLTGAITCDVLNVLTALKVGNFSAAMQAYSGPLLPNSDSPLIADLRNWLDIALREGALRSVDVDAISAYLDFHPYEVAVAEYLTNITAHTDPRYPYFRAKLLHARASF